MTEGYTQATASDLRRLRNAVLEYVKVYECELYEGDAAQEARCEQLWEQLVDNIGPGNTMTTIGVNRRITKLQKGFRDEALGQARAKGKRAAVSQSVDNNSGTADSSQTGDEMKSSATNAPRKRASRRQEASPHAPGSMSPSQSEVERWKRVDRISDENLENFHGMCLWKGRNFMDEMKVEVKGSYSALVRRQGVVRSMDEAPRPEKLQ
eukprot:scaffold679738_cov59-Prasinocladus_malaysianus.AAC.1